MKEPTNEVDKNAISVACTNSHCKEEVVLATCSRNLHDWILVSIPVPLQFGRSTGKHVNHGAEYGLEIPTNFHFYRPEKTIKLVKKN